MPTSSTRPGGCGGPSAPDGDRDAHGHVDILVPALLGLAMGSR